MALFICLVFLTKIISSQLAYEQGIIQKSYINGPSIVSTTITFTNIFQKVPQVIIQPYVFSISNSQNGVEFQITSVTLTGFECQIIEPYSAQISRYYFNWLAVIEDRIQVLNPPKETLFADGKIYTYSHTFSNAAQAFLIVNSIEFLTGGFNFQVSVYSVSSTNVKGQLQISNTKIQAIGYQIILGTREAFSALNIQQTGSTYPTLGQYTTKILLNSLLLYCPFIGFDWDGQTNARFQVFTTIVSPDYQYTYSSFSNAIMTSVTFQCVQFFTQILYPYYVKKYIVSKQFIEFPTQQVFVKFIELNQSFNSDTLQTFNLPSTQSQLNVQIEILLSQGKKIQGYFLKCKDCGSNNKHIINQSYYKHVIFFKYRIQLLQYQNSASTLIYSMVSNKILIQQVMTQAVETYDLISLEIVNG